MRTEGFPYAGVGLAHFENIDINMGKESVPRSDCAPSSPRGL